MRFTSEELWYTDLTWFAVDKNDRVVEFASLGCGRVPNFVIASKENAVMLEDFFFDTCEHTSIMKSYFYHGKLTLLKDIPTNEILKLKKIPLFNECVDLSLNGICCFVPTNSSSADKIIDSYLKISEPTTFLTLHKLPSSIKEIISRQRLDFDVCRDDMILISRK